MIDNESLTYLRAILALVFVVGLILSLAGIAKKTGFDKRLSGQGGTARRLSVLETLYLDPKRRLVIVKCDNMEHVLLLSPTSELLVESRKVGESA